MEHDLDFPDFIDSERYLSLDQELSEADQLRAMLSNLTRIHLLTASSYDSFDELIHQYLLSGTEIFSLETGIVSQIKSDGSYHVLDVISPLEVLEAGQIFPLEDTYCKYVYQQQKVLGIPQVGKLSFMAQHPVYKNLKLEAYLSAPIYVRDTLFGTLNFTSTHSRAYAFSEYECSMIQLLANSIGNYLLLRDKEDRLLTLNQRIKTFVGYVSHDLRTPLSAITSFSAIAKKESEKNEPNLSKLQKIIHKISTASEHAIELTHSILENAAISTGKLSLNIQTFNAKELCQQSIASLEQIQEDCKKEVVLHCDAAASMYADKKRLQQVLENLLINALKYGTAPIILKVKSLDCGCEIKVTNSIDPSKATTEIDHLYSVGFGLDIVQDILKAHRSELLVKQEDDHYHCSFFLNNN
ncbi:GAF domain-containing protein [Agaribacterium sp. ZY112]|uniref:GAF domain-containing sensor histidine kinase n=1 Tax=Agaribacterium sp. ZY112 TaxID=3233574 RepID=UPI003524ABB3